MRKYHLMIGRVDGAYSSDRYDLCMEEALSLASGAEMALWVASRVPGQEIKDEGPLPIFIAILPEGYELKKEDTHSR